MMSAGRDENKIFLHSNTCLVVHRLNRAFSDLINAWQIKLATEFLNVVYYAERYGFSVSVFSSPRLLLCITNTASA